MRSQSVNIHITSSVLARSENLFTSRLFHEDIIIRGSRRERAGRSWRLLIIVLGLLKEQTNRVLVLAIRYELSLIFDAKFRALLYLKVYPVHVSALGAISYANTCIGPSCTDDETMNIFDRS